MKITTKQEAISVRRKDKTNISYYLFGEYEVHDGLLPHGAIQPWHHHDLINETLFIAEGKAMLHYLHNNKKLQRIVTSGDMIQVENTPHTFSNPFPKTCRIIAFRFIPQGLDHSVLIKNDKILDTHLD
jgi:mannose-6-phosphate isomerase-like protein (cupin superfamily)